MAINSTPVFQHRVIGTDKNGTRRARPYEKSWKAAAEAKKLIAQGWTDVEAQTWNKDDGEFVFNPLLNKHLEEQDTSIEMNEDAIDSLANLSAMVRAMSAAASKNKLDEQAVTEFTNEVSNLLRVLDIAVPTH